LVVKAHLLVVKVSQKQHNIPENILDIGNNTSYKSLDTIPPTCMHPYWCAHWFIHV